MKHLLFSLIVVLLFNCNKFIDQQTELQSNLSNNGWISVDTIFVGSTEWRSANHSNEEWSVILNDSLPDIKLITTENDSVFCPVENGYLKGTDFGEWGGKLSYIEIKKSGIRKVNVIKVDNIVEVFKYNNSYYTLEGIDHLGVTRGSISKGKMKDGNWIFEKICDLNDKPYAYAISRENELFVVTSHKLLKIRNDKIEETIIEKAFWESLYPNSIVIIDNEAIIGMRGLLAIVNLKNRNTIALKKG